MTFGISGAALASVAAAGSTLLSGSMQAKAANKAANLQADAAAAAEQGIQQRFDAVQALLSPYVNAGTGALAGQQSLLGLSGADAQAQAVQALQQSPTFSALQSAGETSILQNAAATGGLRGGNTQAALAQFSPQLLAQLIESQIGNLGGIAQMGQASAAGTGSAGMSAGSQIANLMQQAGAARAGGALAQGNAWASIPNAIGSGLGLFQGLGGKF